MTDLEKLQAIRKNYNEIVSQGYSRSKAVDRCARDIPSAPFIYLDEYRFPLYCMSGEYVLIFPKTIYKQTEL